MDIGMALFYFCCAEFFGILRYLAVAATTFFAFDSPPGGAWLIGLNLKYLPINTTSRFFLHTNCFYSFLLIFNLIYAIL